MMQPQSSTPPPNITTIPNTHCFVDAVAGHVLDLERAKVSLSDMVIYVPTRRAGRQLQEAFVRLTDGKTFALPTILPLSDVDEDQLLFTAVNAGELPLTLPPEMPPLQRQFLMATLVHEIYDAKSEPPPPLSHIMGLSDSLCQLLDQMTTNGIAYDAVNKLENSAEGAEHWQENLEFLKIIDTQWDNILKSYKMMDRVKRQDTLIAKQTQLWAEHPPRGQVIIAGSTGSKPAIADFMAGVMALPDNKGLVILPGLDMSLADEDERNSVLKDPTHPQHGLLNLLDKLDISVGDVGPLPNCSSTATPRQQFLTQVMRPAQRTDLWEKSIEELPEDCLEGITLNELDTSAQEAMTIALIMRDVAEQNASLSDKKTCALITPDRTLSRQVLAILKRWNIDADDSAGVPLDQTKTGVFLRTIMAVIRDDFAPVTVLSLLKHPLMTAGYDPAQYRTMARSLEYAILRGGSPQEGLQGLRDALDRLEKSENSFDKPKQKHIPDAWRVIETLDDLQDLYETLNNPNLSLADKVGCHIATAETLANGSHKKGADILWAGDHGRAVHKRLEDIRSQSPSKGAFSCQSARDYELLIQKLLTTAPTARLTHGTSQRLKILGAIESRMVRADVVILGGLNEGTFPPIPMGDHWLSRPMRAELGLPPLEQKIGLSAHDFVQAFSAPEVHLTRAKKADGQPTTPSRWLDRIKAVIKIANAQKPEQKLELKPAPHALWQKQVDAWQGEQVKLKEPNPKPDLQSADPHPLHKISVSDLETLFTNPYGIFAKKILKLYKLDDPQQDISRGNIGNIIHDALEKYIRKFPDSMPEDALEELLAMGKKSFATVQNDAEIKGFWYPRFKRIATWFVGVEKDRRPKIKTSYAELDGSYDMELSKNHIVTLTARADRVDLMCDGTYQVSDYKTGKTATDTEIKNAKKPQLLLATKILEDGIAKTDGKRTLLKKKVSDAFYWKLKGKKEGSELQYIPDLNAVSENPVKTFEKETKKVLEGFLLENEPYAPTEDSISYDNYEHLSRKKEWGIVADETEED